MPGAQDSIRALMAGQPATLALPLALAAAARIQERDADDFAFDPTDLANALRDLIVAVGPDAVPVTTPGVLLDAIGNVDALTSSPQLEVALEATRRTVASFGPDVAVAAVLPGPGLLAEHFGGDGNQMVDPLTALGKEFLSAGATLVLIEDSAPTGAVVSTLANIARFHQGLALSHPVEGAGLPATTVVELDDPAPASGVVVTPGHLPRDTDLSVLIDWVSVVRG